MGLILHRIAIKYLLRKMGPESFSISGPESQKNNFIYIWLIQNKSDEKSEKPRVIVEDLQGNTLSGTEYRSGESKTTVAFPVTDLGEYSIEISHNYRSWTIIYRSLFIAYISVIFRRHIFIWMSQSYYDRSLKISRERIKFLRQAIEMSEYNSPNDTIDISEFAVKMYGPSVVNSARYVDVLHYINKMMYSYEKEFEVEGDNMVLGKRFKIKPTAFATLSDYEESYNRHKSLKNIFLLQFLAALILAALYLFEILKR